jgi:hypothetical protein
MRCSEVLQGPLVGIVVQATRHGKQMQNRHRIFRGLNAAVSVLDGICAENNLPMYFYRDGVMRSGIIPCRIENGIIGLKARAGYLKDEQEKEQKERNIFLATLS